MDSLETIKLDDGFTVKLYQDEDAESSREWSNVGTMATWHKRYQLGGKEDRNYTGRDSDVSPEEFLEEAKKGKYLMLPLALLDHSGLHIYVGSGAHAQDPGGWDSGQVGWIFVTPEKVRAEGYGKRITKKVREKVLDVLRAEVEALDQLYRGDVYGYVIEDKDGNHVDSLWGMYGFDYAKEEALAAGKSAVEHERQEAKKIDQAMHV